MKKYSFHFILFSISPVIALYTGVGWGIHCIAVETLFPPILINLAIVSAVLALFYVFTRQLAAAAIFSSIFIIWFYNYGALCDVFGLLSWGTLILEQTRLLMFLWLLVLFILWFMANKLIKMGKLLILTHFFNVVAVILLGISLLSCLYGVLSQVNNNISANKYLVNKRQSYSQLLVKKEQGYALPDIYFIILDAYTNNRALKEVYGYDNSGFLSNLQRRGFFVAERATSNYPMTGLSLPATLNMGYLDEMPRLFGRYSQNISLLCKIWRENEVVDLLKSAGYGISDNCNRLWYQSEWGGNKSLTLLARVFSNEFNLALLEKTIFLPWRRQIESRVYRELTLADFSGLEKVERKQTPKFYYVHIFSPHGPFVFGPNGEEAASDYITQIKFVNKRILAAIDRIKAQAQRPPIIVIQGDHGAYYHIDSMVKNLPPDQYIGPQFGVLNAMLLPGKDVPRLPNNLSSVNTFRIIMNLYFQGHYPLLANKHYYSTYPEPFIFHDVTAVVERYYWGPEHKGR